MKIIKQGKLIMFCCKCCGCEFVEGAQEIKATIYDDGPVTKCPCCGQDCKGIYSDKLFGDLSDNSRHP